jgi:hypothetical protein
VTRAVLTIHPSRRTTCNLPAQMTGFRGCFIQLTRWCCSLHSRWVTARATVAGRRTLHGRRSDARSAIRRYRDMRTHRLLSGAPCRRGEGEGNRLQGERQICRSKIAKRFHGRGRNDASHGSARGAGRRGLRTGQSSSRRRFRGPRPTRSSSALRLVLRGRRRRSRAAFVCRRLLDQDLAATVDRPALQGSPLPLSDRRTGREPRRSPWCTARRLTAARSGPLGVVQRSAARLGRHRGWGGCALCTPMLHQRFQDADDSTHQDVRGERGDQVEPQARVDLEKFQRVLERGPSLRFYVSRKSLENVARGLQVDRAPSH